MVDAHHSRVVVCAVAELDAGEVGLFGGGDDGDGEGVQAGLGGDYADVFEDDCEGAVGGVLG